MLPNSSPKHAPVSSLVHFLSNKEDVTRADRLLGIKGFYMNNMNVLICLKNELCHLFCHGKKFSMKM